VTAREWNVSELLIKMKTDLPLLLRYEAANKNYRQGHPDYNEAVVTIPVTGMPADELLGLIADRIPGWQATQFPSHMIFYRESRDYPHGTVIRRHAVPLKKG
jgi:hypothetical protein